MLTRGRRTGDQSTNEREFVYEKESTAHGERRKRSSSLLGWGGFGVLGKKAVKGKKKGPKPGKELGNTVGPKTGHKKGKHERIKNREEPTWKGPGLTATIAWNNLKHHWGQGRQQRIDSWPKTPKCHRGKDT